MIAPFRRLLYCSILVMLPPITSAQAQSCSGDIVLYRQEHVDNFSCAEVTGSLQVLGGHITDLTPLNVLTSVTGFFYVSSSGTITSLAGLNSLTSVSESLTIAGVASLEGLDVLTSVGRDLNITGSVALVSLAGLESLTSVGGNIDIRDNQGLVSLAGLESLTSVGGYLDISYNIALTSLTGINALVSIGGTLNLVYNDTLTSLAGLNALTSIGGNLRITGNALVSLAGLDAVASIGGDLTILSANTLTSLDGLNSLTSVGGDVDVLRNTALVSIAGFNSLTSVSGYIDIDWNSMLTTLEGFQALTDVGGDLIIENNDALTSLVGLENLTSVGSGSSSGDLEIIDNAALTDCACGLVGLISGAKPMFDGVGGNVVVESNAAGGDCNSPDAILEAYASCNPTANETLVGNSVAFSLAAGYPNPARPNATPVRFDFELGTPGPVIIAVYDLLGREVARLIDEERTQGRYEVTWDGTAQHGQATAAGTYLVRLEAGASSHTQRLTIIR